MEAHPGAVDAHPGPVDAHPGAVDAHPEAMKCSSGVIEPHPGAVKAYPGAVDTHLGAMKGRVSSKQSKINFVSNRNKPKQDLFRVCFGLFRETKKIKFWFVSVF